MQEGWHYQDDSSGTRIGPVSREDIAQLAGDNRFHRTTLVWEPTMTEWAVASTTSLSSLFASEPPPLPKSSIGNWAIYMVAVFPIWGTVIIDVICSSYAENHGLNPKELSASPAWILFFMIGNTLFADIDRRRLKKVGIDIKGGTLMAAFLFFVYLIMRGRALRRVYLLTKFRAYLPLYILIVSTLAILGIQPFMFGTQYD